MSTSLAATKAIVIIPYYGRFGPWFPLYLHSLARQQSLHLLLITDGPCGPLPANATHVLMTLPELRARAAARLATTVRVSTPRKLCDLRPAFGLVFEEFIQGYSYWAYGDEDVLYGDFDRLLAPHFAAAPDFIVPSRTMTIGHLTLVRNARCSNELVLGDPAYAEVLASEQYWAYDESSWARGQPCSSFTTVLQNAEARGEVTVRWGFPKRGDVPWPGRWYVYEAGAIRENDRTEIAYFHWGRFRSCGFPFPSPGEIGAGFGFDRYGFFDVTLGRARRLLRQARGRTGEVARTIARPVPGAEWLLRRTARAVRRRS